VQGSYFLNIDQIPFGGDLPADASTPIHVDLTGGGAWSYVTDQNRFGVIEEATDKDWFSVLLSSDESYRFEAGGAGFGPVDDIDLRLFDARGNVVASSTTFGDDAFDFSPTSGFHEQYYIEVDFYQQNAANTLGTHDLDVTIL